MKPGDVPGEEKIQAMTIEGQNGSWTAMEMRLKQY